MINLKKKRITLSLAFFFLLLFLIQFTYSADLKVTEEHPFYINGTWIPAKDLQVGDELTTVYGKKAIIKNIEDIYSNITVYNLHVNGPNDFFANDILVHNKPMRATKKTFGIEEPDPDLEGLDISIIEGEMPFEDSTLLKYNIQYEAIKSKLSRLDDSGVITRVDQSANGQYNIVYIVNGDIDPTFISPKIASRKPEGANYAVKLPKQELVTPVELATGHYNAFREEIFAGKMINKELSALGVNEPLAPEPYFFSQRAYSSDNVLFYVRTILVEEVIPEMPVKTFINQFRADLGSSISTRSARAIALRENIRPKFNALYQKIRLAVKKSGYEINDMHSRNIVIGFKDRSGRKLEYFDVLNSDILPGQVDVYVRVYELGGSVWKGKGLGGFVQDSMYREGDRGLKDLENILKVTP